MNTYTVVLKSDDCIEFDYLRPEVVSLRVFQTDSLQHAKQIAKAFALTIPFDGNPNDVDLIDGTLYESDLSLDDCRTLTSYAMSNNCTYEEYEEVRDRAGKPHHFSVWIAENHKLVNKYVDQDNRAPKAETAAASTVLTPDQIKKDRI